MAYHLSITFHYLRNIILCLYWFFRKVIGVFGEYYSRMLYLIALVVIINELIISLLYIWSWPEKDFGELNNYSTVLIVADPQILGERTEYWIARLDSDRFLRNSFRAALRYTQPDVILFLGDLMDEGSVADEQEFSRYLTRFKWIFESGNIPTVFVPGDNDIGGENEPVYFPNVERFEKFFGSKSDLERFENLEFYKVNKILRRFPNVSSSPFNSSIVRIAISHIPVLGYADDTSEKVVRDLRPQLIFSAHDHKSFHFVGDLKTGETTYIEEFYLNNDKLKRLPQWRFQHGKFVTNELVVPTCSYRMGVEKIGYGVALIDKKGLYSCYMILWFPQRLHQLAIYLYLTVLIFIYLIVPFLFRYCKYLIRKSNKQLTSYKDRRSV